MTPERLARFFVKDDGAYRVTRDLVKLWFSQHRISLADAPFSRIDLISCRNASIHSQPEAQRRILSLFHFALRENGVLFLGSSETGPRKSWKPLCTVLQEVPHIPSYRAQPAWVNLIFRASAGG